jgi:hypothetical protein
MFGAPESELPDDNFAESPEYYVTWNGSLGTNRRLQLSRRLTLTADTDFSTRSDSTRADTYQSFGGGGTLRYGVGRGLALKAGYFYTRALYSVQDRRVDSHQFDVGVDFNRALSISRRTSVSFSTGTSAVTQADGNGTRLRATGTASLEHEIGRTWTAALNYRRGMQFMDAWPEPVFSDSLTVTFGGLLTRRLQFSANGRAATGEVGVGNSSGFGAYHGGATLSYALSRYANVGIAYSRYHHRFDESAALAPGFGPSIDRQRVVAQVSLWAPLFHRARRDNAAR